MKETPQEYTQRVLGYIEGKEPMDVLAATPKKLARLVKDLPRKRMARRSAEGHWSVTEVLAHLADTEMVYGCRIRLILEGGGAPIQGIDQDAWARFSDYPEQKPERSLEAFRINRERLLWLLKRLPEASWELFGMHSERGRETVRRMVELLAGHDVAHMNQIRRQLAET